LLYLDETRNLPTWADHNERVTFSKEMRSLGKRLGLI